MDLNPGLRCEQTDKGAQSFGEGFLHHPCKQPNMHARPQLTGKPKPATAFYISDVSGGHEMSEIISLVFLSAEPW